MKNDFLERVELHERAWGEDAYAYRPSLSAILASPVVSFWRSLAIGRKKEDRYTIRLFADLKEIERFYTKMLFRAGVKPPDTALVRIYVERKRYTVAAVRILFKEMTDTF